MPQSMTLTPSHLPTGTLFKMNTDDLSMERKDLRTRGRLTSRDLGNQIGGEKSRGGVREVVPFQFQIGSQAHDLRVLRRMS